MYKGSVFSDGCRSLLTVGRSLYLYNFNIFLLDCYVQHQTDFKKETKVKFEYYKRILLRDRILRVLKTSRAVRSMTVSGYLYDSAEIVHATDTQRAVLDHDPQK